MSKLKVAVLCGGYTAERNISLMSGEVVFQNIDRTQYDVFKIVIDENGWFESSTGAKLNQEDFSFSANGSAIKFDCVFNAIHGSPGEDGKIQGYFDMMKIPYSNCGVAASAITFNKFWTKEIVRNAVPLAADRLIRKNDPDLHTIVSEISSEFTVPVFVKPNNNGSSYGVSKVKDFNSLEEAISEAFKYDHEVLIEQGIAGTEVTCGVYKRDGKIVVLPICEIVTSKHEFFDYTAKYKSGESDEIIPANIPSSEKEKVEMYSVMIYELLNCKGIVRIDFIINDGTPYMLEVNTVPGLSEASIVPKMAKASGLTLASFFDILIRESLITTN